MGEPVRVHSGHCNGTTIMASVRAGLEGVTAGEIANALDIPPATLTFHLKELSHAGLIQSEREGRSIRYAICVEAIQDLFTYLMRDCCAGHPELCRISLPGAGPTNKSGRKPVTSPRRAKR